MRKCKGLILGMLIGSVLMFSAQGYAEDGLTEIKALLRTGLNITLDGKKVELDNPSINYNGSTYIKLRDAGKLTGTGVEWNEKTQTVEMTSVNSSVYGDVSVVPTPTNNNTIDSNTNGGTTVGASTDTNDSDTIIRPYIDPLDLNVITSNLSEPTIEDALEFISINELQLDLTKHQFGQISVTYKKGVEVLQYNGKIFPTEKGKDTFYDSDGEQILLSKSILMNYFTADYLTRFNKYSVDFDNKTALISE
jgi:hypothetical protein